MIYDCLQFACYMGFKKIYLLGIDHNLDGAPKENDHFTKDYKVDVSFHNKSNLVKGNWYCRDAVTRSFQSAAKYAKSNGIEIYNCTRGGELEVFERKGFDEIMEKY